MLKYNYFYVLQGNYGYGWDDLIFYQRKNSGFDSEAWKEAKQDLKDYRDNESASFRIIERKILVK